MGPSVSGPRHHTLLSDTVGEAPGAATMDLSAEFAALIATAADGTLPRPQVEAELHSALAGGEPVLVLLRGVPGSGKTCLLARALRERGSLHHFLRRGHTESALWRDPH